MTNNLTMTYRSALLMALALLNAPFTVFAAEAELVDDFSHATKTIAGFERQYLNDSVAGGASQTEQTIDSGVIKISGDLTPPRGQPGWASTVLPLSPLGVAKDASKFEGIKLLVKVDKGNLSISANSTLVTNFDYHAAPVMIAADGKFHEVKIPFSAMKRGWSEQTTLDTSTLNSLSIVAYSLQKASFSYALDDVSFY